MQFLEGLKQLSDRELGLLGMEDLAYVKPVVVDGTAAFAVHAANGTQIAVIADRELAFVVVRQHDLEPVSVHCGPPLSAGGMFAAEARWVGGRLAALPPELLSPLLNIGSSTSEFRDIVQPWMARHIFRPLAERGVRIVHLDAREGPGIDIRADLLDDADFARIRAASYRAVLCCNVLEHVRDPGEFARRCAALVTPGGVIVVTVPRSYPHHGDPIDTLYRPTPEEAAALFPTSSVTVAEIIDVGESYADEVRRRPWLLLRHLARAPAPFLGLEKWRRSMRKPYWLFHNYQVSAAVLRRE